MTNRFEALRRAMQRQVDGEWLAGLSSAVLVSGELVDEHCCGFADREQALPMRRDHVFRVFSNTKLITSCAALLLWEQGRFGLDEPVEQFIPALANRQVLCAGATRIDDTEAARSPITLRQLFSHSAGLSTLLDPGSTMFQAYTERKVLSPRHTLAEMMDVLGTLPLSYQPGTRWEYSIATDVIARVVEVVSGQPFDAFIRQHVLAPLGMGDTCFVLPADQAPRLAAMYTGADLMDPCTPGLQRNDKWPGATANLVPVPKLSGSSGLVSTLPDMVALLRSLLPSATRSGRPLLKPETLGLLFTNQLAEGLSIGFSHTGPIPGRAYSLAGALTLSPWHLDPSDTPGDLQWGGIAGTHWWISPRNDTAGLVMAQRQLGFWNPYWFELKAAMLQGVRG